MLWRRRSRVEVLRSMVRAADARMYSSRKVRVTLVERVAGHVVSRKWLVEWEARVGWKDADIV